MAEQVRRGHDAHVHARVLKQYGEGISPGITVGTELVECGAILPGVFVPSPGVTSPDGIGLSGHILCELLDQFFQLHHQNPFVTLSMASNPNSRWAS